MNSTMKWSLAAGVAILIGIFVAVIITTKPVDNENITNDTIDLNEDQVDVDELLADQPAQTLNNYEPSPDAVSELEIIDLVEGDGQEVEEGDSVTVDYTGAYVVNGEVFDTSIGGEPISFPLSGVIEGWQEGVPGMKVGGTRRLIIPGSLAYGEAPGGYIPGEGGRPLGPLVFDIELKGIGE